MYGNVRGLVAVNLSVVSNQELLVDNLEQQLSEVEMIEAMFPNPGEFMMDDPGTLEDCRRWLKAATSNPDVQFVPPSVGFQLNISLEGNDSVQVFVSLSQDYPSGEKAEIYVKSESSLNRRTQSELNKDLANYIDQSVQLGEVSVFQVISWLQESIPTYVERTKVEAAQKHQDDSQKPSSSKIGDRSRIFARYWIYSHHIYSKIKRRNILDLSKEYQLTGFSMPGKPGIICLEGSDRNVTEAWGVIKSWNWKKINIKHHESDDKEEIDDARRFHSFEEIGFIKGSGGGDTTRDYHMDMGEFQKFLDQNNCGYIFKELFGL